jgi:hypothetical protein
VSRIVLLLWLVGICGACLSIYNVFININSFSKPNHISIRELENEPPFNRHLAVTGAYPIIEEAVIYHRTRRGAVVDGSEFIFVPMREAILKNYSSFDPFLLVKVPKDRFESFVNTSTEDGSAVQGIRMTHWELPDEAEKLLAKKFGTASVKRMLVLEFEKKPKGFLKLLEGFLVAAFICGFAYLLGRVPK